MSKTTETRYGRYIIKTMSAAGECRSRAFRGVAPIGEIKNGATAEASILTVKTMLDVLGAAELAKRGPDGFPTAQEVRAALAAISISQGQWDMLNAHLHAPDQTLTATQLAAAAGYKDLGAANLQYGLLARTLAGEMGWEPVAGTDGVTTWTFALATGADHGAGSPGPDPTDQAEWRWKMRPQIAEALTVGATPGLVSPEST